MEIKTKIIFFLALILYVEAFSVGYYKCKPEKSYTLSNNGILEDYYWGSVDFTIDRKTGEYRAPLINRIFKVVDKGNADTHFRAIHSGSVAQHPGYIMIQEFSESQKKPYLAMDGGMLANVSTGFCKKF